MGHGLDQPPPLASDTGRLALQTSASEKVRSSDDREAELAASLLAQRLLLLAVLLAELLALLHGLRRLLVAFLLLDLALRAVDEAFAIGRRRRRRQRIAQLAGLLAVCQLRRGVVLALFEDALFVDVLAWRWTWYSHQRSVAGPATRNDAVITVASGLHARVADAKENQANVVAGG